MPFIFPRSLWIRVNDLTRSGHVQISANELTPSLVSGRKAYLEAALAANGTQVADDAAKVDVAPEAKAVGRAIYVEYPVDWAIERIAGAGVD
jgi:hypothetical protein